MFLSRCISLFVAVTTLSLYSVASFAAQCAAVDCNCEAFTEPKWRSQCEAQEQAVLSQCAKTNSTSQSYCGLHGPAAFPVATAISSAVIDSLTNESPDFLLKQVDTQAWSLAETTKAFRGTLGQEQYARALQVANMLDDESTKLYQMQLKALNAHERQSKADDLEKIATRFATDNAEYAAEMAVISERLWLADADTLGDKEQRALKILSFKLARTAGATYEFAADMAAQSRSLAQAAGLWQQSATLSRDLINRESLSGNNPRHIAHYQAQAAARWNRATFYWLQTDDAERVAQSRNHARLYSGEGNNGGVVSDNLHAIDQDDVRAIKRGN